MLEKDPRAAGDLKRYHTWRTIQEQTVAAHSWHYMRILLAIWPECPREILIDAMFHDIGEIGVGDLPYPVKAHNPNLKAEMDKLERDTHLAMCLPWSVPAPIRSNLKINWILKLAHMMEMWEFGLTEFELGNNHGKAIVERCMEAIEHLFENPVYSEIALTAKHYIQKRTSTYNTLIAPVD